MSGLSILGSTGTIGVNTLDVVARHPGRIEVVALTANTNVERMAEQCCQWRPRHAAMASEAAAAALSARLREVGCPTEVHGGPAAVAELAALPEVSQVMAGIVGAAGLLPTLAAARAGKRVLLANKEALVMSGALFMEEVRSSGAELLPIDSEHNAIFQCLPRAGAGATESSARRVDAAMGVRRILLTASGGPFRTLPPEALATVTPDQACAHPNWVMGRKISVDSATMMNKGLEVIEACWLFDTEPARIDVVFHPQSVIHSMVEYVDGSVIAQLGNPDMRTPIAYALGWPERLESGVESLDFMTVGRLDFEPPDPVRFPCLGLAYEVARSAGGASTVLNAANEVAVGAFLDGALRFTEIPSVIEHTLAALSPGAPDSIDAVLAIDQEARTIATGRLGQGAVA